MLKSIVRKIRIGLKVFRAQGSLEFLIICLQKLQARKQRHRDTSHTLKRSEQPIYTKAKYVDLINVDFTKQRPRWKGTNKERLTFNWIMPPPGKGSGGHHNIFRFIKYLEEAGHECRIYLYLQDGEGPISDVLTIMGDSYPKLYATKSMQWLHDADDMKPADGIFATSWETAYPAHRAKMSAKRFYFVQDFEPYFYPVGSFYALAENTYRLGFYGITAGDWLAKKLERDYGMDTDYYNFGADPQLYTFQNQKVRKEIFFYVRPYTERRGFEIGVMALDLFHKKHPDYKINLAGWDVSEYDIPFPYENLRTLELDQLDELYNRCAAGLILSFTNMSLLPLELMASGAIPVVNDAENNTLVSSNPHIAYAAGNPVALASKLSEVVVRRDAPEYARKAAESALQTPWSEAGKKFACIVARETRKHE